MWPMQPRSAPRSVRVTKAPRFSAAPGTPPAGGRGRSSRCASSVARARPRSAARSAGVSSGSAMVGFPPADGVRAVQLLEHDHPGQLVRERQPGEAPGAFGGLRSEEHTSELQSRLHLVCRLLLEKKKKKTIETTQSRVHVRDATAIRRA